MSDFGDIMKAVGSAAQAAGKLGEKAYSMMSNSRVTNGIKGVASKAYNAAKRLQGSANLGAIGRKAVNAARSFKNAVRNKVNPQALANSASRAANFIGRAAQGAGSKIAQVGSTIKNTFNRYGGWKGFKNRALAPTNVGNQTNPFRMPKPALLAAMQGETPQKSIFMPNTPPSTRTGWGGLLNRSLAPTNVGNRTNPFRMPKPALLAAMQGQTPQESIFMPKNNRSGWWGRGVGGGRNMTLRKRTRR